LISFKSLSKACEVFHRRKTQAAEKVNIRREMILNRLLTVRLLMSLYIKNAIIIT
jgi:hypothetical protein